MADDGYIFPAPSDTKAVEWPGTPIGISNTITKTKGRTAHHDKTIDRIPGKRDQLVASILSHIKAHPEEPVYQHDVIIHGVKVRAQTNSRHLHEFWVDNWYSPEEWESITGQRVVDEPHIQVYAFAGVETEEEAAYYSRNTNTVIFFNTAYYGQLKSWVLGAVGRVLAEEYGIHSIHGACVEKDGKGILYIAPTGTGKSASSYGLMSFPNTRFHSDDWVYVRYTVATKDGRRVSPLAIAGTDGSQARGYRVFRWLEERKEDLEALVTGRTLADEIVNLKVRDLDLIKPIEAYAYTSEKVFYLRANLVETFPRSAYGMLRSKFENLADVAPQFMLEHRTMLKEMSHELRNGDKPEERAFFGAIPQEKLEEYLARMFAFDNARAMLDMGNVLPKERIYWNPMEPVRLRTVFLIKRDPSDRRVIESLSESKFMTRLLIGETPDKKRETAYNAYRAVNDKEERDCIDALEKEVASKDPNGVIEGALYEAYRGRNDIPETLYQEFELFRIMYKAARCYDLNTILMSDPKVNSKREAVEKTMTIIAKTVDEEAKDIVLTLDNYRQYATL